RRRQQMKKEPPKREEPPRDKRQEPNYDVILAWFMEGNKIMLSDEMPFAKHFAELKRVPKLAETAGKYIQPARDEELAFWMEMILASLLVARSHLVLDTPDLTIRKVSAPYSLGKSDPILGAQLTIDLPAGTKCVTIEYETSPNAGALQWLDPAQTAGKKHPYL